MVRTCLPTERGAHGPADIVQHLPMSLATKHMRERYEKERKESGLESLLGDEMDLFNRERTFAH